MCDPNNLSENKITTVHDTVMNNLAETIQPESTSDEETPSATTTTMNTTKSSKPPVPIWYSKLKVHENSLEDQSHWFSKIFLFYLSPLLRLGSIKALDEEDIGVPSKEDQATQIFHRISKAWKDQLTKTEQLNHRRKALYDAKRSKLSDSKIVQMSLFVPSEPSLVTALMVSFGVWNILWAILLFTLSTLLALVPVILLKDMTTYFSSGGQYQTYVDPWVEVMLFGLVPMAASILQTQSCVIFQHFSVYARTAVSTLVYDKAMSISAAGRASTSTGQVVNMMSNDSTQLQRFIQGGVMIIAAPIQIIICLILIFREVGNATWAGVGFMLFLVPINAIVVTVISHMRRKVLKYSDLRVKLMNEIITGIRIIKYYAWEKPFQDEVGKLRAKELQYVTYLAYVSVVGLCLIFTSAPIIQLILVFYTYVQILDRSLTASTAFTTVALFNIIRVSFGNLPMCILQSVQSKVSLCRLARYLQQPERVNYVNHDVSGSEDTRWKSVGSITIHNGTFSWASNGADSQHGEDDKRRSKRKSSLASSIRSSMTGSHDVKNSETSIESAKLDDNQCIVVPTLRNINLSIKPGELIAIIGSIGSGKSSLLSAILGEMEPSLESFVMIPNDGPSGENFLSYCCQSPWVVHSTIKENILFGRNFDEERYNLVIDACALTDDIRMLPAGDSTEIGERGINLSGGQKARISLARALYSSSTKILLLDDPLSAVDSHVGEHLFSHAISGLSMQMTRIFVTHNVHFLPRCDRVLVLENGEIQHFGTYSDLVSNGVVFDGVVDFDKQNDGDASYQESEKVDGISSESIVVNHPKKIKALKENGQTLISVEERQDGSISMSVYSHYIKAGGVIKFATVILFQATGRTAEVLGSFWLSHWVSETGKAFMQGTPLTKEKTNFYLAIYAILGIIGIVSFVARAIVMAWHRLFASKQLHDNLTQSILRAPVAFFDGTPVGRVLNRFASDMDKIDLDLNQSIGYGIVTLLSVLGAVGAITGATKGTFLVPFVLIGYFYYFIQKWFLKTSTELQRLTSISCSSIVTDFSQILSGAATIRAYEKQSMLKARFESCFDKFNASSNLYFLANFWLGLQLDLIGGIICAFIAGLALATISFDFIPAGWVGLALSFAIEVTFSLKLGVTMVAVVEADMTSVERVLFYSEQCQSESTALISDNDPDRKTWPNEGVIEFDHFSLRYRHGPLVLNQISFKTRPGEKIGVVGRTGSGKSSLINGLFRIMEIEKDGGRIIIDGVDISGIGLEVLRRNLCIIPQEPVMFSNTVRYNLDPFSEVSDDDLWSVLAQVQLQETIIDLPHGLDQIMSEGGENFSQGQRQLICIARSLLHKTKILLMDEATASIDNSSDAIIQKMIRTQFADSTVLTIAHRLNTIMDSDRILVLDHGKVAEFDTPKNLLRKQNGIFRALVDERLSNNVVTLDD